MAFKYFNAEGVPTDGTQLTTSNQGASGNVIAPITGETGSITGTAVAGEVIHGAKSVKLSATDTIAAYLSWQESPALNAVGFRSYIRLSSTSANYIIMSVYNGSGVGIANVILLNNGHILLSDSVSTTLLITSGALTLPGIYAFDLAVQPGASTTTGKIKFAIYDNNGNLAAGMTSAYESTTCNAGTQAIVNLNVGKVAHTNVNTTMIVDDVRRADNYGLVGPESAPSFTANISGGAVTNQVAKSVRALSTAGSTGTPNPPTVFEWTRTAGQAVTITNASSSTASYNVPATKTNVSTTIQLRVGDGSTWSSPVSVTDTIAKYPVWYKKGGTLIAGTFKHQDDDGPLAYDWSESNLPWAYSSTSQFTADWPTSTTIVDIQTGSSDFYTNLVNTVNAAGGRCVVRLGAGVYRLNQFRLYGTSGDPQYSFGFYIPNLQGLLGQGPDKTFVQMDANSMTQAQLDRLAELTLAAFYPIQMGLCRVDGSPSSPVLIAGITFRAQDQQMLTNKASDVPIVVPQPAPHNGVVVYPGSKSIVSYTRFQAAARACLGQPPFETGNLMSAQGRHHWHHIELDGRLSPDFNPARPRRCGVLMSNNETEMVLEDTWFHHSNVSRYAVNDQNHDTSGAYVVRRVKGERISDTENVDPALNGGVSLGGWGPTAVFGWESTNGPITIEDSIVIQDGTRNIGRQVPQHIDLTSVGNRNPQGGRLTLRGGRFYNNGWPHLNDYLCIRIVSDTYWYLDGPNTTLSVYYRTGQKLAPYQVPGSWPPSAASLSAAGVTPATHYLVWS